MIIVVSVLFFMYFVIVSCCNITKFSEWKKIEYTGSLATDSSFWRYQSQSFFVLRNELALPLLVSACKTKFKDLFDFRSGLMGPVDIQTSYKQMCSEVCLENDAIHQAAMIYTGCSCLELSTEEASSSYSVYGDFCLENSARLYCDLVGFCGVWECRIDDFMCPRYEYNKKHIPYKGFGNCDRSSGSKTFSFEISLMVACIIVAVLSYI